MRLAALVLVSMTFSATAWSQQPDTPRTFLLIVDDLHLDFRATPRMREFVKQVLAGVLRDKDVIGVVSTGYSSISERFTTDRNVLQSVTQRVTGGGLRPEQILSPAQATEIERRARISLATMSDALKAFERETGGPRVVIYLGDGFRVPALEGWSGLDAVINAATAVRAQIHGIWLRGVATYQPTVPDSGEWRRYVTDAQQTVRMLAEGTGGLAVMDPAGLDGLVRRLSDR